MTITFVASALGTNAGTSATTTVGIPGTVAAGQRAVLVMTHGGGVTNTTPTGWTAVAGCSQSTASIGLDIWTKTLVSGDVGAAVSVTSSVSGSTAIKRTLTVLVYSSGSVGASSSALAGSASTTHTAPALTVVNNGAMVINVVADRASPGSSSFTLPGNLVQRQFFAHTGGAAVSTVAADDDAVASGTQGGNTVTGTVSTANAVAATVILETGTTNTPPTVNAGPDQTGVEPRATVTLTGTDADSDGTISTRAWTQTAGTTVTLSGASTAVATFTAPATLAGATLTFQYRATDNLGASSTDTVNVTVLLAPERVMVGGAWVPSRVTIVSGATPGPPPPPPPNPVPVPVAIPVPPPLGQHTWTAFSRDLGYNPSVPLLIDTLSIIRKHMDVDTATISTPFSPDTWAATAPATGLLIYRDGLVEFSGLIQARQLNWDGQSGRPLIHLECVGDDVVLAQRLVMPDPLRLASDQTVNDYWTYTGVASTAMRQLISDQAGPTCLAARQVPGLVMGSDPGVGISRTWQGLFNGAGPNGVLDQLAVMSAASGADLGVRVTGAAGVLTADIVAPRDLADSMRFSANLGNLVGLFYRETAPTVTHALAAGQGDLHARLRKLVTTTDPLALQWGISVWSYIDRRDTADATVLAQACTDALAQGAPTVSLTATLTDSQAGAYHRDWDLGDRITVYVGLPGQTAVATVADVIRQISLTVDNVGKEVIQPAIGSYDAKATTPTPTQRKLADAANALSGLISRG